MNRYRGGIDLATQHADRYRDYSLKDDNFSVEEGFKVGDQSPTDISDLT